MDTISDRLQLVENLLDLLCNEVDYFKEDESANNHTPSTTSSCHDSMAVIQITQTLSSIQEFLQSEPAEQRSKIKDWAAEFKDDVSTLWEEGSSSVVDFGKSVPGEAEKIWDNTKEVAIDVREGTKDIAGDVSDTVVDWFISYAVSSFSRVQTILAFAVLTLTF